MIVVQKFVEGQVFQKNKGNYEQILESAQYLGMIIEGFKNYKVNDSINILNWYSNKEFEKANRKYDEILSKLDNSKISENIRSDITFKKELLVKLSEIVNAEVNTVPNNLFIVLFLFIFINFVFFDSIQTTTPSLHMSSSQLVSR